MHTTTTKKMSLKIHTREGEKESTDIIKLAQQVLQTEVEGILSVSKNLGATFTEAIALLAQCKGRVIVIGIGKSGIIGKKIAATLSSTGTPAFFLHPVEGAHGDIGSLHSTDIVIAISNSGETPELNEILPTIKLFNIKIIALTANPLSTLGANATVIITTKVPKEACPYDLAPTASTTAVLALGDAIAIALMSLKSFSKNDFLRYHPGGTLGQRLHLNVREIMLTENLPVIPLGSTQKKALSAITEGGIGAVIIVKEDNRVCGIITDGDIRRSIYNEKFMLESSIEHIMTKMPLCGTIDDTIGKLIDHMEKKTITVLPIIDHHQKLLGIVHLHDLLGKGSIVFSRNTL